MPIKKKNRSVLLPWMRSRVCSPWRPGASFKVLQLRLDRLRLRLHPDRTTLTTPCTAFTRALFTDSIWQAAILFLHIYINAKWCLCLEREKGPSPFAPRPPRIKPRAARGSSEAECAAKKTHEVKTSRTFGWLVNYEVTQPKTPGGAGLSLDLTRF